VAFTAPVPRPPRGLSTQPRRPLNDALTSPWVSADSLPFLSGAPDLSKSLRSMCSPTVSLADAHSELGPCSLDPTTLFESAFAERIWDQTPPTDFCNCISDMRATKPASLVFLAGTVASTTFLFFPASPSSLRKR